ncbi:MAG: hypothetical protein ACYDC5_06730 [Candidatus Dormibacteria bacterium]
MANHFSEKPTLVGTVGGVWVDAHVMGLLSDDWNGRHIPIQTRLET